MSGKREGDYVAESLRWIVVEMRGAAILEFIDLGGG